MSVYVAAGQSFDAAGHMALDEAILLSSPPDALILRVYRWADRGCTFGYSQKWADAVTACGDRWEGVSPVRRATGGGIVFHDGDVTFSLVFPWDRTIAPEAIYKNIHRGIHAALKAAGQATRIYSPEAAPSGLASSCFARAEKMDLIDESQRKILGGALRKKGVKGLYQGSLRPEHLDLPRERIEEAISAGIDLEFGRAPSRELEPAWLEAARELDTRYRSADWNRRR